jgi:cytidylate kinase
MMEFKPITIAIDGYSACGKSTLAKDLAKALGYVYVDSGAMYRAVTYYFMIHQVDIKSTNKILEALDNIEIYFVTNHNGAQQTFLNGVGVEKEIRSMEVSNFVSEIAEISEVRRKMVEEQRRMGQKGAVVMDGRDIGSVVFPNAELKIFLTASEDIRVKRRYKELIANGQSIDLNLVKENLKKRDHIDSTRNDSPLVKADDAIVLDNSDMTRNEQLDIAIQWAKKKINIQV